MYGSNWRDIERSVVYNSMDTMSTKDDPNPILKAFSNLLSQSEVSRKSRNCSDEIIHFKTSQKYFVPTLLFNAWECQMIMVKKDSSNEPPQLLLVKL